MTEYPKPAPSAKFVRGDDVARRLIRDLDETPERWHAGPPFDALDIRPGRVIVIGAPPGVGKTTAVQQIVTGLLGRQPELRCVVGNVETAPGTLAEKMLARLASVELDAIMNRTMLAEERALVEAAVEKHEEVFGRMAFLEHPFTIAHTMSVMQATGAKLAVLDYVQRFVADDGKDSRSQLDKLMGQVRNLAGVGAGVILVSSVSRQKSSSGSSNYKSLSMASLRGSAELEFGADSIYMLKREGTIATLECCKQRFGNPLDIALRFDGPHQRFDVGDPLDAFDSVPDPAAKGKGAK